MQKCDVAREMVNPILKENSDLTFFKLTLMSKTYTHKTNLAKVNVF